MYGVCHEVVHDSQSLCRWTYATCDKSVVCLFSVVHFPFVLISGAKIGKISITTKKNLEKLQNIFWIFSKFVTFVVLGETKSSERDENGARGCGVVQYFEKKQNFRR